MILATGEITHLRSFKGINAGVQTTLRELQPRLEIVMTVAPDTLLNNAVQQQTISMDIFLF